MCSRGSRATYHKPKKAESVIDLTKLCIDDSLDSSLSEKRTVRKFHCWNELPTELKIHVLQFLPFATLRNFMLVSKQCYSLASTIKPNVASVILEDIRYVAKFGESCCCSHYQCGDHSRDAVCLFVPDTQSHQISFTDTLNGRCFAKKGGKIQLVEPLPHSVNARCAALEAFFRIMSSVGKVKLVRILLEGMTCGVKELIASKPTGLLKCDMLDLVTEEVRLVSLFLPLLAPGCELRIRRCRDFLVGKVFEDPAIFDTDVIKFATAINFAWRVPVTDEQIVRFQAQTIIMQAPRITSRGIIQLIQQWIRGERNIARIYLCCLQGIRIEEIILGLGSAKLQHLVVPSKTISEEVLRSVGVPSSTIIYNVTGHALIAIIDGRSCKLEAFRDHTAPRPS